MHDYGKLLEPILGLLPERTQFELRRITRARNNACHFLERVVVEDAG